MFSEIGRVKFFLSVTRPHSRCVSQYIFLFIKTHKQKAKETKEEKRKRKETKELKWKENVAVVNSICGKRDTISYANLLCVRDRVVQFLLVVHMNLTYFMRNERNMIFVIIPQHMKYTLSTTKII